jgi:hypothetical protein
MGMVSPRSGIEVTVTHSPLAFIYHFFTPTIQIDETKERRPWGVHLFPVAPGDYDVTVSYPWLFSPECGKNSVRVRVAAGQVKRVKYRAGFIRYLPGTISVEP